MSAPRRLLVIRHAKSDWETDAPTDHARPLNARGRRDAPRVAAELVRRGWLPDLVCASDAARTRETWARMQAVLPDRIRVQHRRSLYHAGTAAVREQAQGWPVDASCIAVVGHNPGWEQLIEDLSDLRVRVTTANVICLEGAGRSWTDALARPWRFEGVIRPRELTDAEPG